MRCVLNWRAELASILFVCTANICRSPMAEALMKARHPTVFTEVQSAGVHAGPRGEPIDARAAAALTRAAASPHKKFRSRRVLERDFEHFDLIVAMESAHLDALRQQCPPELRSKLRLLRDDGQDVPDPYFGPAAGFEVVLTMIERELAGLVAAQPKRPA